MRIAVNLRSFGSISDRSHTLLPYVRNVVRLLDTASRKDRISVYVLDSQVDPVRTIAPNARIVALPEFSAEAAIQEDLLQTRPDVLFCPLGSLEPQGTLVPAAVTFCDPHFERLPRPFDSNTLARFRQIYGATVLRASIVFTFSVSTKQLLVETFSIDPGKIHVVRPAGDELLTASLGPRKSGQSYIVHADRLRLSPETLNFLRAFRRFAEHRPGMRLVLDMHLSATEAEETIRDADLEAIVDLRDLSRPSELADCYAGATAAVIPSRPEPGCASVLHAMHASVPLLAMRYGTAEEVAGDAAFYADGFDPESILIGLNRIVDDVRLRECICADAQNRVKEFSWDALMSATLQALHSLRNPDYAPRRVEVREWPTVSIVTPTYNMGRFLKQTVESVLSQDYPNIDYIVMDAGSGDETVQILESYANRIRFESKPDKGQADAVNQGFARSNGSIFTFLNADDTYYPGAVGSAVKHMLANPTMGVVYGEAKYVTEDGSEISRYPTRIFDAQELNRSCFICQPAAFMWREVFETSGRMNPDLHYALDYDLWIRIAKKFPMLKIDEVLATSRMYPTNKTLSSRRSVYMEGISIAKEHYGYVPFDWVFGYACYVIDRKDQFFDLSRPNVSNIALSLVLGSYYNKTQIARFWREWAHHLGIGSRFQGRYADGWISRTYTKDHCSISETCEQIVIEGRHLAPFKRGLELTIRFADEELGRVHVREHGPFSIKVKCPPRLRGCSGKLTIEAANTFRPGKNGDYRLLSCIIDSMSFGD